MRTVIHVALGILFFLIALRSLFSKAPATSSGRSPDAADRAAYELIFRRKPPSPSGDPDARKLLGARVFLFLLFTILGVVMIARGT